MAVYRDHPRTGGAHAAHVIYITATTLAAGSAAVFLLVLICGLVGDEVFSIPGDAFDPIFRGSIGAVALVLGGALGVAAFALAARRYATAQQLARAAEAEPDAVATWADRQDVEIQSPFAVAYVFGCFFLGLDALGLLIFGLALQETFRYNPESAMGGLAIFATMAALGALVVVLLVVVGKVLLPRWRDAAGTVGTLWNRVMRARVSESERANRPPSAEVDFGILHRILSRAGTWLGRAALPTGGVGFVVFMIGVWTRQPCRGCDERYFDRPIESFIDVMVLIGGVLLILCLVLAVVGAVSSWGVRVIELARLRRLAIDGGPSPRPAQLLPHLVGMGPSELAGIALIAVSWPIITPLSVAQAVTGEQDLGSLVIILVSVGVVGVLVLSLSVPVDDGMRNRLRTAWSPGDPVPVTTTKRARSSSGAQDAGD